MITNFRITGLMFAYSTICERKLWLFSHNIGMEQENEMVELGKLIDEESYSKHKKHINLDNVCIDYMKDGMIYEIKKSSKQKEMAYHQIKYYLYTLYKKGIENPKGILKIPTEKLQEEIILTNEDIVWIEKQIKYIEEIIASSKMPETINQSICRRCAYYESCYI